MKRKKQGYNDRLDESLGSRRGAESAFRQTLKDRRDESKGMAKKETGHAYSGDHSMDERYRNHMAAAHHRYMAQKYKRQMHKK